MSSAKTPSAPWLKQLLRRASLNSKPTPKKATSNREPITPEPTSSAPTPSAAASSPSILAQAEVLQSNLSDLIASLKSDTPDINARRRVLASGNRFLRTLHGPFEAAYNIVFSSYDAAAVSICLKYKILHNLPASAPGKSTSTVSAESGLPFDIVQRCLKIIATHEIVRELDGENEEDRRWVVGEMGTAFLHETMGEILWFNLVDCARVAGNTLEFLEKTTREELDDQRVSGFSFLYGRPLWEQCAADPKLGMRVQKGMEGFGNADKTIPVLEKWLKSRQLSGDVKFIDVGGGNGHVCAELAKAVDDPSVAFEVQDIQQIGYDGLTQTLAPEIRSRLGFRAHDFFTPQPAASNDGKTIALLVRRCLHDWGDAGAIRILKGLVPTLESSPGSAILINETLIPDKEDAALEHEERGARRMDMLMWLVLNAKERMLVEWKALLKEADPRLEITEVLHEDTEAGSTNMAILVVNLKRH